MNAMKSMNQPSRYERLAVIQKETRVDAFLFTSPSTVKWLSNYFYNFETGPSPFHLLPSALLIVPGQLLSLVIADNETFSTSAGRQAMSVISYASYSYEKPLDYSLQFLNKLHTLLKQVGLTKASIGIEQDFLPYVVAKTIGLKYPAIGWIDVTREITSLKAVKDADEIMQIRAACCLCDIGQAAVVKHAQAGMTELELFNFARLEMEASAGTRVPVMADLVSGKRTATGGGIPTSKVIQPGDLILSDITPCLNGYWGDSCNTMIVGTPNSSQREAFKRVSEALHIAIHVIRPGVKAMEIDSLMRKHIGDFPHHGGHGVGTQYHEEPRIVPCNAMELVPNMVIALEPGIYNPDFGIRLEHLVLVTETGCEILTKFEHYSELTS
jgi:Xaa-Pro aminopeptidase